MYLLVLKTVFHMKFFDPFFILRINQKIFVCLINKMTVTVNLN